MGEGQKEKEVSGNDDVRVEQLKLIALWFIRVKGFILIRGSCPFRQRKPLTTSYLFACRCITADRFLA